MNCPRCGLDMDSCGCWDEPQPSWPIEAECAHYGHAYYGDDEDGGRCYCGEKRYPKGGPEAAS